MEPIFHSAPLTFVREIGNSLGELVTASETHPVLGDLCTGFALLAGQRTMRPDRNLRPGGESSRYGGQWSREYGY